MFRSFREKRRVSREFNQLAAELGEIEADLANLAPSENELSVPGAGPRDYTLAAEPDRFVPPAPAPARFSWRVWLALIGAIAMILLPMLVLFAQIDANLFFWLAETIAAGIFLLGLFLSLRNGPKY